MRKQPRTCPKNKLLRVSLMNVTQVGHSQLSSRKLNCYLWESKTVVRSQKIGAEKVTSTFYRFAIFGFTFEVLLIPEFDPINLHARPLRLSRVISSSLESNFVSSIPAKGSSTRRYLQANKRACKKQTSVRWQSSTHSRSVAKQRACGIYTCIFNYLWFAYSILLVKMKWNTNNTSLFLQVFQQYPTLWNIKLSFSNVTNSLFAQGFLSVLTLYDGMFFLVYLVSHFLEKSQLHSLQQYMYLPFVLFRQSCFLVLHFSTSFIKT